MDEAAAPRRKQPGLLARSRPAPSRSDLVSSAVGTWNGLRIEEGGQSPVQVCPPPSCLAKPELPKIDGRSIYGGTTRSPAL